MNKSMAYSQKYISELDGLRALSVGFVLLIHGSFGHITGGFLGVDIFFVISGFIITRLLMSEYSKTGRLDFKKFYMRRIIRIFPPLLVCVIMGVLYMGLTQDQTFKDMSLMVVSSLFFVSNFQSTEIMGVIAHTWSLAIEEQFYIIWPALFLCLLRGKPRSIFIVLTTIVILTILARIYILKAGINPKYIYSLTFTRIDGLAIGALLAVSEKSFVNYCGRLLPLVSNVTLTLAMSAVCFCLFFVTLGFMTHNVFAFTGFAVFSAALIFSAIYAPKTHLIKRGLNLEIMRYFGRRSYGLYLYHYPIFRAIEYGYVPTSPVSHIAVLAFKLGVSFLVTELSWRFMEKPLLALKTKYTVQVP